MNCQAKIAQINIEIAKKPSTAKSTHSHLFPEFRRGYFHFATKTLDKVTAGCESDDSCNLFNGIIGFKQQPFCPLNTDFLDFPQYRTSVSLPRTACLEISFFCRSSHIGLRTCKTGVPGLPRFDERGNFRRRHRGFLPTIR